MSDICFLTAVEMAEKIRQRELSVREVMEAHLEQIEKINPVVNAIVTMIHPEKLLEEADAKDRALAGGEDVGPLHGLPVAHKDLAMTKGLRTTFGSKLFKDFIPEDDSLIVERLKKAGAITIGKTNTPEFGAGSQTFNEVFGETANPYDITKTCGGSSGGAAVALACGMLPVADGSDMGGSLRNPASFCNVVGLRPSPGRVPVWPSLAAWFPLSVEGPMARTVRDIALILTAIAGPDPRSPISIDEPGCIFAHPLERDFKDVNIAWSMDMGGLPVDPVVMEVIGAQREVFESLGCITEERCPDFSDADEIFRVLRAWNFELAFGGLLDGRKDDMKDTVIWNIEEGRRLTGTQIGIAEKKRTALYHSVREFMETCEYMIFPVSQVPPFDLKQRYITEINGIRMDTYIDWMKSCCHVSTVGNPAISVPCGFTKDGLPVGVQIVGRHRDDFGVLQLAHAFETATGFGKRRPELATLTT